jgi:G3E family GTPase
VNKEVFEGIYKLEEVLKFAEDFKHTDHTVRDSLTQKVAYLKVDINFNDVDEILENLPDNIYRVKGVVRVKDVPNAIFVNYSFGDVSFEEVEDYKDKSLLIFIGDKIDNDVSSLCKKFDSLNVPLFSTSRT